MAPLKTKDPSKIFVSLYYLLPQWCCQCEKREPDVCEGRKLEPLNKEESIRSPRLCAVFGKHDEDPYEKPCIVKPKGQKYGNHNSLGDAVGMITADFLLRTDGRGFDIAQLRYATCLVAFGAFHIYPETVLNSTIFEEIMKRGLLLCSASQKDNYQLVSPPDVYGPHEQEVLRDFGFNEFKFHFELVNIPYKALIHIMKRSDGGDMRSTLLIKRIKSALESVVREHTYYLLCVNEFYLMIWLNERVYFIFDVRGRRTTDFNTDEDEGVPMLIGLKTLDNVNHLILNLSGLNEVDPCSIRGLKVIQLVSPSGNIIQRCYGRSPAGSRKFVQKILFTLYELLKPQRGIKFQVPTRSQRISWLSHGKSVWPKLGFEQQTGKTATSTQAQ
uniref:Uncharacterized protein n=1 Tax=Glossina morsitans morsitans TaxID=37546 RepID=A0A1B0GCB8_GLOMM